LNRLVGGMSQAVSTMTSTWQRQEDTASAGRRTLHEKFEALAKEVRDTMTDLKSRVAGMEKQITVIQPSVDAFKEEKLRIEGAKKFGLGLWSALVAAAGMLGWIIHEVTPWFNHLPPSGKP